MEQITIGQIVGAINVKNLAQDEAIEENYKVINKLKAKVETQQEIINQMPQAEDEGYEAYLRAKGLLDLNTLVNN